MENATTTNTGSKYNPQEYVSLADKTYLDFIKDGRYGDIISGMAGIGDYTLRNQMLILQQYPNATKVNSMSGWNFNKRNIQKGSQSIKILAPVFDSVVTSENGNIVEKKSDYVSGYKINFVFDISQTEAKNLDEMRADSLENLEPYYSVITKALKETLKSYDFHYADIENDGILDTRRRTVTIKEGLSEKQALKTLIEQVAAALVLGRDRNKFQGLRSEALPNVTAIEITAVSDIVARRLGLEGQNLQVPNFGEMTDENIEKFANNIGIMRSVSQIMIRAVDNAMTETLTQERIANEKALEQPQAQEPVAVEAETQTKSRTTTKTTTKTKVKAEAEMA